MRWSPDRAETDLRKRKKHQKEGKRSNIDNPVITNEDVLSSETSSEFEYNVPKPSRPYLEGILNENYASDERREVVMVVRGDMSEFI